MCQRRLVSRLVIAAALVAVCLEAPALMAAGSQRPDIDALFQRTATLRVGNNLWNYLPKIDRTIRVPPAAMLGSWMGTDFTNDDLVKESSLYVPYGRPPKGGVLLSEYGAAPLSGLLQLRVYF